MVGAHDTVPHTQVSMKQSHKTAVNSATARVKVGVHDSPDVQGSSLKDDPTEKLRGTDR